MFQAEVPNPLVFDVGRARFHSEVIEASDRQPILVDFWADWCSLCHALSPYLQRVIRKYDGSIRLAKVEVDGGDDMKLAGHYRAP